MPLVFEAWKDGKRLFAAEMPLSISRVEEMYRWINLRGSNNPPIGMTQGLINVLFIHGANVDLGEERAWAAEIYKRLFWSGACLAFWPVSWESDIGASWNYQENVSNAFVAASRLGPVLLGAEGRNVVLAHSLGTLVAAAAIQDYNAAVSHLFMFNSAIPSEAFDPALANLSTSNHLVHAEWVTYPNSCWAAQWHTHFPSNDARSRLTWRGRFADVPSLAKVVNYYSSGDEVLELYEDSQNPSWYNGVSPFDGWGKRYSWHKQELWKGRKSFLAFAGTTDWSGWGFKMSEDARCWSSEAANAIADPTVFATNTVFNPYPVSIANPAAARLETDAHLAMGIPSLSPATGRMDFENIVTIDCYDMNTSDFMMNTWPRPGSGGLNGRFLHSDIKSPAYLFVYPVFQNIVEQGALNP